MRIASAIGSVVLVFSVAGCQDVMAPEPADEASPAFDVTQDQQTGPANKCYGAVVAGIASTWPWAHNDKVAFPPPPGALALWVKTFGPGLGITTVRELQILFCG
jgi:hypothetical protein